MAAAKLQHRVAPAVPPALAAASPTTNLTLTPPCLPASFGRHGVLDRQTGASATLRFCDPSKHYPSESTSSYRIQQSSRGALPECPLSEPRVVPRHAVCNDTDPILQFAAAPFQPANRQKSKHGLLLALYDPHPPAVYPRLLLHAPDPRLFPAPIIKSDGHHHPGPERAHRRPAAADKLPRHAPATFRREARGVRRPPPLLPNLPPSRLLPQTTHWAQLPVWSKEH